MSRRAGYIGFNRTPVAGVNAAASGVWKLDEVQEWRRDSLWPDTFYSPSSISGLQLWLDASDSSTLFDATSGGSLVSADGAIGRWQDKSGNGRHATQLTVADRPVRKTSVQNGLDVVRFDGSGDFLDSTDFLDLATDQSMTAVAVIRRASTGADHTFLSKYGKSNESVGSTADGWGFRLKSDNKLDFFGTTDEAAGVSLRLTSSTVTASNFTVLTVTVSAGSLSLATFYQNGTTITSSASSSGAETLENTTYAVTVGALRYTFNSATGKYVQFFNGDVAELAMYNAALSAAERTALENHLISKWGIS